MVIYLSQGVLAAFDCRSYNIYETTKRFVEHVVLCKSYLCRRSDKARRKQALQGIDHSLNNLFASVTYFDRNQL